MKIENLAPGGFAACTYLVTKGPDAVLIDCAASPAAIERALTAQGATLRAILLTHGHFDHILTADAVRKHFGVPMLVHEADAELPQDAFKNASAVFDLSITAAPPERCFTNGERLLFGELCFEVCHTPGHTAGCAVLFAEDAAFTGDTLFHGGFGRTDLFSGNEAQLRASLRALSLYDPSFRIYPGHGSCATLGDALNLLF